EREAFAGRDGGDAGGAEIGPDQAGAHEPEMRRHDEAVELLVRGVGKREDGPIARSVFALCFHFDAPDDAVSAGRGGNLEIGTLIPVNLDGPGEVERNVVARDLDRLDGPG